MIQNITSINSYLNNMKMETIWNINKQDPEKARIEKQQKQQQISKRISDIRTKLKSGKKLSAKDMKLLREHAPDLYKKAEAVQQERKNFEKELKNCRTKDEVQRLLGQKLQMCSTIAKTDQETAEYMTMALQDEHTSFMASDDYKNLKWESEQNVEKTSKNKSKKTKGVENIYQDVLKRAKQLTEAFDVDENGKIYPKDTQKNQSAQQNQTTQQKEMAFQATPDFELTPAPETDFSESHFDWKPVVNVSVEVSETSNKSGFSRKV